MVRVVLTRRPQQWLDLQPGVTWPGEVDEFVRLLDCVGRHCTCHTARECGAHQLLGTQRTLDHLVYARGARQHFVDAEWSVEAPSHSAMPHLTAPAARTRRRMGGGKITLVAGAFAALAALMSLGGAWQASATPATAPIGAWTTR